MTSEKNTKEMGWTVDFPARRRRRRRGERWKREGNEGRAFPGSHVTPFPSSLLSPSRHIRRFASHLTEKSAEYKVTPRSSNDEEKPSAGAGGRARPFGAAIDGWSQGCERVGFGRAPRRAAPPRMMTLISRGREGDEGDLNRRQSNCQWQSVGRTAAKKSRWHFVVNV